MDKNGVEEIFMTRVTKLYPAWNIYQQPIFCINLLSVPESSVSLSGEYWSIAYVLPNPTTGLGPFWILLEKIPQWDVSQVQVYLIIIKLIQNLDWVDYNVN